MSDYWTNDSIKRLDEVLQNLGDELDSIMVSQFNLLNLYLGRGISGRNGRAIKLTKVNKRIKQRHTGAHDLLPTRRVWPQIQNPRGLRRTFEEETQMKIII